MSTIYPVKPLSEVLTLYQKYIEEPEPRIYPKLSVKWYGKGAVLDTPANGLSLKMKRHQLAKKGQVILSEIWGKKGAIGIVPPEGEGALCTSHFFLFDIRNEKVLPQYLQVIFTANYLEPLLNDLAQGTTGYASVKPHHLLTTQIPLPPLDEQCRIVARIEELAAKIAEARGLRKEAEEKAETLPKSYLATIFEALTEQNDTHELGNLLIEAGYGTSVKCSYEKLGNEIPVLRIPNVISEKVSFNNLKYGQLDKGEITRVLLAENDVLVVRTNGSADLVGRSAVVPRLSESTAFASYMIRIRCDSSIISSDFLQLMLRHLRTSGQLFDFARSTAGQYNVSLGRLRKANIPVPPLDEQRRIVAHLNALQAKVDALKRQQATSSAELDALLPSILDKAFRGEL